MLVDGEELVARCVRNNPDALGRRVAIGEGIAGRVARTKEPILINGKPTSQEFPGLDARTQAVASSMSVPLVHRDQVLGVLNVNADPGSTFNAYELRALSMSGSRGPSPSPTPGCSTPSAPTSSSSSSSTA